MKEQKSLTPKIKQAINYHTNNLARTFHLQFADKEDVRQELTLKALQAAKSHTYDMNANIETYIKQAIFRKAIDLARTIVASPLVTDIDAEYETLAINENVDLVMDIQSIIKTLSERQKIICTMLMAGYTQKEIAKRIGITQRGVCFRIQKLRQILQNLKNGTS